MRRPADALTTEGSEPTSDDDCARPLQRRAIAPCCHGANAPESPPGAHAPGSDHSHQNGLEPANRTLSCAASGSSLRSTSTITPRCSLSSCGWTSCTSPSRIETTLPTEWHLMRPQSHAYSDTPTRTFDRFWYGTNPTARLSSVVRMYGDDASCAITLSCSASRASRSFSRSSSTVCCSVAAWRSSTAWSYERRNASSSIVTLPTSSGCTSASNFLSASTCRSR